MKPNEITLVNKKDFITMVARDLISPNPSNDNVKEILAAFHEIDTTVEVLAGCSTCQNIYKDSFKIILAYCNGANWFETTSKDVLDSMKEAHNAVMGFATNPKPKK